MVNAPTTQGKQELDTTAPTTTASPPGGFYATPQSVTLTCVDNPGGSGCAATYYTTDGTTTPTTSSTQYSSPINISSDTTILFFSTDNDGNSEWVKTESYEIGGHDTTPPSTTASPPGGTYSSAQTVTLTCTDNSGGSGCDKTYFTTDGSTPSANSIQYFSPITLGSSATLKFFSSDNGGNLESVKTENYVISIAPSDTTAPTTTASPVGGTFSSPQTVTLTCTDNSGGSGCDKTYYTTNGSAPTTNSSQYSSPISISSDTTLKFFSTDLAGNSESVNTETYVIDATAPTTTASPAGGAYTSAQSVTLACVDNTGGSGCFATYYTTDGTTPTTSSSKYSGSISISSNTVLKFFSKDLAGNSESVNTETYVIDATAPTTTASPAGGAYTSAQSVTLACVDNTGGSGCNKTYYTTDGSAPTSGSSQYSSPILIQSDTTLKYFSSDKNGNIEQVKTENYVIYIDTTPPTTVAFPAGGTYGSSQIVTLACTDNTGGSGCFATYYTTDGSTPSTASAVYSSSFLFINNKTLKFFSRDFAGNTEPVKTDTYVIGVQAYTTLSLQLTSQTILQNGALDATGKITRLPDNGADLSGLTVKLTITAPDNTTTALTATTYDSFGHYQFLNLGSAYPGFSGFTQKGTYSLQTSFAASSALAASSSTVQAALVGASAGYAIIVEGKLPNNQGLQSHNKTANRIYKTLTNRGFIDPNIYYFNYNAAQTGVDAAPTKAGITNAITSWAMGKMNGAPAPLYVIFHDHGNTNTFYIDNDTISPTELDLALSALEGGLNINALLEKRIFIYGACYSGSFIPILSKPNRVIITSAAANEPSYKGPMEADGVRSGSYFLEEFFKELGRGYSLKSSFEKATKKTETFTRKGGASANTNSPYFDGAVQHPHLDDNNDKVGSNILLAGGDGQVVKNLYLGAGAGYSANSAANPAEVLQTTGTVYLGPSASSALLWAKANDDSQVGSAWMEIRPPSISLTGVSGTNQAPVNLTKVSLTYNPTTSRWERVYTSFTENGAYEIFYFVSDAQTQDISPATRSVVYKNKAGNSAPAAFSLISPADGAQENTVVVFEWAPSSDPDGVTYNLVIATDPAFGSVAYREDGISANMAYVDSNAGLQDLTTYYWTVQAVDGYGAVTNSAQAWSFKTDNTNSFPGVIFGRVLKASDNSPIVGATVSTDLGSQTKSLTGGAYILKVPSATNITLTASNVGYSNTSMQGIKVSPGGQTSVNMPMAAMVVPIPDIKANGSDGPITITQADTLSLTVSLNPGTTTAKADWWMLAVDSNNQTYYFDMSANTFKPGQKVTYQGALGALPSTPVFNTTGVPRGSYTFYFGVDMAPDGIISTGTGQIYYDSVVVNVM